MPRMSRMSQENMPTASGFTEALGGQRHKPLNIMAQRLYGLLPEAITVNVTFKVLAYEIGDIHGTRLRQKLVIDLGKALPENLILPVQCSTQEIANCVRKVIERHGRVIKELPGCPLRRII